jgi:alpha-1,2-mannosyltransferase
MYTSTLAASLAFAYVIMLNSSQNNCLTLASTYNFATGAIVGWPFALALALPFVFEELFIFDAGSVAVEAKIYWMVCTIIYG